MYLLGSASQSILDGADYLDGFVVDDAIVVMENISRS